LNGTGIDLHSGHTFNASLVYDGTTLQVTITDTTTQAKATQSYTVNIPSIVGGNTAFVGFTGATGGLTATQNVLSWTYTVTPAGGAPAAKTAAVVLPATLTTQTTPATTSVPTAIPVSLLSAVSSPPEPTASGVQLIEAPTLTQKVSSQPKSAQAAAHDAAFAGSLRWLLGANW
jgi:hypothetical protein